MLRKGKVESRDSSKYNAPTNEKNNENEANNHSNGTINVKNNDNSEQGNGDSNNYPPRRKKSLKKRKHKFLKSQVSVEPIISNLSSNNIISGPRPVTVAGKNTKDSVDKGNENNNTNENHLNLPTVKITVPGAVNEQDSELTDLDQNGGVEVDDSIDIQKRDSQVLDNSSGPPKPAQTPVPNKESPKENKDNNDNEANQNKQNGTIQPDKALNKNSDNKPTETLQTDASSKPEVPKVTYYDKIKEFLKTFVADKTSDWYYYWTGVVSIAFMYNLIVIIARVVFVDLNGGLMWMIWLSTDLISDIIYIIDIFVKSRTGFLEQGLL
uniref:Cyclic nucleotide-gated cation channel (inferred by orthology to a C. elegans protein) n=1 Tax=Strongyloides venezuelensis TaxID=75913 RepID=A0A0K0FX04_STRVS